MMLAPVLGRPCLHSRVGIEAVQQVQPSHWSPSASASCRELPDEISQPLGFRGSAVALLGSAFAGVLAGRARRRITIDRSKERGAVCLYGNRPMGPFLFGKNFLKKGSGCNMKMYNRYYLPTLEKKKRTSWGPRIFKGGIAEDRFDDAEVNVFEIIEKEEFVEEPPVALSEHKRVTQFSLFFDEREENGIYNPPEYRPVPVGQSMHKAMRIPQENDLSEDQGFQDIMAETLEELADGYSCEDNEIDVVISDGALRILLGYLDGRMTEAFEAMGFTTARRRSGKSIDLLKLETMPGSPRTLCIGCVSGWDPDEHGLTHKEGLQNKQKKSGQRSYSAGFLHLSCGSDPKQPKATLDRDRTTTFGHHYKIYEQKLGDLKLLTRSRFFVTVPSKDDDAFERPGQSCYAYSVAKQKVHTFWDRHFTSRYTMYKLADIGMVARGVTGQNCLLGREEITMGDMELDRPTVKEESELWNGRIYGLIQRLRHIWACPGIQGEQIWVQFLDGDLRVVTCRTEHLEGFPDLEKQEKIEEAVLRRKAYMDRKAIPTNENIMDSQDSGVLPFRHEGSRGRWRRSGGVENVIPDIDDLYAAAQRRPGGEEDNLYFDEEEDGVDGLGEDDLYSDSEGEDGGRDGAGQDGGEQGGPGGQL